MTERSLDTGDEFPDDLAGDEVDNDLNIDYAAFAEEEGGDA
jgi:hypothetical protein